MAKKISKRALKWIGASVAVAVVAFIGVRYLIKRHNALPEGIVSGNGRIEAKLVDVAAKEPLRVKEILVDEGALVKPGQVLVRLDTVTLESQLAEAKASIDAAEEKLAVAKASIVKQKSEIDLAAIEADRSQKLVAEGAGSQRELDVRRAEAGDDEGHARGSGSRAAKPPSRRSRSRGQTRRRSRPASTTRRSSPPSPGRVLYRLAEAGEVLAPGGKALTLVNLEDVYMEIFLPSEQAASVKIGAEGRITVDYDPKRAVAGYVSFVSPEAQFTPKQVETKSEREKLMFRVKIQVPKEVASQYVERIKTGVRGVGYVKVKDSAVWPAWLQNLVAPPTRGRTRRVTMAESAADPPASRSSPSRTSRTATARSSRSTASRSTFRAASWSASWAPTASASRRCWRSSPGPRRCSRGR